MIKTIDYVVYSIQLIAYINKLRIQYSGRRQGFTLGSVDYLLVVVYQYHITPDRFTAHRLTHE